MELPLVSGRIINQIYSKAVTRIRNLEWEKEYLNLKRLLGLNVEEGNDKIWVT